jgi:hypothetical protein
MKMSFKYNGRNFSSASQLTRAMERDMRKAAEDDLRTKARRSGLSVRNTRDGLELKGTEASLARFERRLK